MTGTWAVPVRAGAWAAPGVAPVAALAQQFAGFHGEAVPIALTGETNTNPTAYALKTVLAEYPGGPTVLAVTPTVSGAGPYVLTTALTAAQTRDTLTACQYFGTVWRTDAGSEAVLATFTLTLAAANATS